MILLLTLHYLLHNDRQDCLSQLNAGSSHPNGRKDKRGRTAKPSLNDLSSLSDSGAYMQWKESINYYRVAGWSDMDLLPYAFNSLRGEVGKLALTFSSGLPLRDLITKLDEHFGIIANLDTLWREFYSMKQGTHETVFQFAGRVGYQLMGLQTTFPRAIPQCDEEEIKKGRLCGSLKLHLKSAMTFCMKWPMKEKILLIVNSSRLLDTLRLTIRAKIPQDFKRTKARHTIHPLN